MPFTHGQFKSLINPEKTVYIIFGVNGLKAAETYSKHDADQLVGLLNAGLERDALRAHVELLSRVVKDLIDLPVIQDLAARQSHVFDRWYAVNKAVASPPAKDTDHG